MIQGAQTDFIYILKKYKKSKRYSQLQELHIQCIVDELKGMDKDEHYNKFFEILHSSLTTISSFKFLIICHKLIYQLQQEFTIRFIQNKLIPGEHTDKSRLAIYYYNFLFKICENFDYYKEVIDFIETDNIIKFLKYELFVQIQILYPLATMLQELSQVVKLLDYLLCRESPLLLQLGTCILKDFCVIYNFLSTTMQEFIYFKGSFKRSKSTLSSLSNHYSNDKMHEEIVVTKTLLQFQITTLLHYHY
ncbi:unnamed protein product [Paramecium pentaurelia]|uniref:Uncharacterized protein n=1 Tax=Paramecium pentaurelia TaxID=43138 RepID=A0A8S1XNF0_9CILI|nr:unnamed protein product [Paramecium pentaurelia]